jgi:hypothetical protein
LKQLGRSDSEFCLYQGLCLENLLPCLHEAGYTSEEAMLSYFEARLARFTSPQVRRTA